MKFFISHSHDDSEMAEAFVDFLVQGVGIKGSDIFSSSLLEKGIPLGFNLNHYIIRQLKQEDVQMIALVTNNYFNSNYCMFELGITAGLSKHATPVLGPRMKNANMDGFFSSVIVMHLLEDKDINKLIADLRRVYPAEEPSFGETVKAKSIFVQKVKQLDGRRIIRPEAANPAVRKNLYKYKVVAFDFDGTLLQSPIEPGKKPFAYSWKAVWKFLKYHDSIRKDLYDRYISDPQGYPYQAWCDECAEYFIREKFHRSHVAQIIKAEGLKLADGLFTTLTALKKNGFVTAVISGGIDTFYEEIVPKEIKDLFDKVFFNEMVYDPNGYLTKIRVNQNRESDFGGKIDALRSVCDWAGCRIEDAVFVGEGTNDIAVARSGCLSIAYPPTAREDFANVATIETEDYNLATILGEVLIPREPVWRPRGKRRKR